MLHLPVDEELVRLAHPPGSLEHMSGSHRTKLCTFIEMRLISYILIQCFKTTTTVHNNKHAI